MATRCNIVIKRGEDEILIYRHWDGKPSVTGVELLKICQESNYDFFRIIQSMARDGQYELTQYKHGDAEYEYTVDIERKDIGAINILDGIWLKSDEFGFS